MRSLIASLQMSEKHGLLKRFGTAVIVSSAMSFKMEVNKEWDHQHLQWQIGADECCIDAGIDPSLPSPASIFEPFQHKDVRRSPARWESGHFHKGQDQLSRRSQEEEMDYKGLDLWK